MEEKKKYAPGKNPNSRKGDKNLVDIRTKTAEEQRIFHSIGGKKSQEVQHEKVIIQKIVEKAVNSIYEDKDTGQVGNPIAIAVGKIIGRLMQRGDIKDLEAIAKYLGQEPAQKVEQLVITPEVDFDKLEQLRKALKDDR